MYIWPFHTVCHGNAFSYDHNPELREIMKRWYRWGLSDTSNSADSGVVWGSRDMKGTEALVVLLRGLKLTQRARESLCHSKRATVFHKGLSICMPFFKPKAKGIRIRCKAFYTFKSSHFLFWRRQQDRYRKLSIFTQFSKKRFPWWESTPGYSLMGTFLFCVEPWKFGGFILLYSR